MKNQLRELVAATRHFVEQKSPRHDFWAQFKNPELPTIGPAALTISDEIKPAPSEPASHSETKTAALTQPPPPNLKPVKTKTLSKNAPPTVRSGTKSVWELQAMPLISADSGIEALKKKMAAYIPLIEPKISVLLALSEEFSNHQLFLESLSKAITRAFASASVVPFSAELLSPPQPLLIVTPLVLIQKKYPQAEIHTVLKEGNLTLLPLDHLDRYQDDLTSKRSLWTVIQHLFQS